MNRSDIRTDGAPLEPAEAEARYDADARMLGRPFSGPGYHSRVEEGRWVHPTRDSLNYDLALLEHGAPASVERAVAILDRVMQLQDADPSSATYGVWPWVMEEPLSEMAPPDFNWADFGGEKLAIALGRYGDLLPASTKAAARAALGRAARAIFRRNVRPGYTNISVLGGVVTLLAGELCNEPWLSEYGIRRLERFEQFTIEQGGFEEYNSPTYAMVVIEALEVGLELSRDEAGRAVLGRLHRRTWQMVADSYHPSTGQWAGRHSRTYTDLLAEGKRRQLVARVPVLRSKEPAASLPSVPAGLGCPENIAERFVALPEAEVELCRPFVTKPGRMGRVVGVTWLTEPACLGSVNRAEMWVQRRPLIGYWVSGGDKPAVLRLRVMRDGRDFASGFVWQAQRGPRVLSVAGLITDGGDWHLHLDPPEDGRFTFESLTVRYELRGAGATVEALAPAGEVQRFAMRVGDWQAAVHAGPAKFDGQAVSWRCVRGEGDEGDDVVAVEAAWHAEAGAKRTVRLAELGATYAVGGVEVLPAGGQVSEAPVTVREGGETVNATWAVGGDEALAVEAPARPRVHPERDLG